MKDNTDKQINSKKELKFFMILSGVMLLFFLAGCSNGTKPVVKPSPGVTAVVKKPDDTSVSPSAEVTQSVVKATATPTLTPTPTPDMSKPSLEKLLRTAMKPVGSTLYVWGGGWNEEDTGAGTEARTIGLSSAWREFFDSKNADYNYKKYDYEIHNGLDCSGYVGWVVYNTLESEDGREGYVCSSTDMAKSLADKGLGRIFSDENKSNLGAGDIVSMKGHVYIVLGTCSDGSLLIVHSSPPGVRLAGTVNPDGSASEAVSLAFEYTQTHFPEWFERYGSLNDYGVSRSYFEAVNVFRWSEALFEDYRELANLSPRKLLERISGLPEWFYGEELSDDSVKKLCINTGDPDVMAAATLETEHMLRFESDSRHEACEGYEWITFNCRVTSSDVNALNNGYTYMPFIADRRDITSSIPKDSEFVCNFRHINSGVYENEGKRIVSDTFSCELRIPAGSKNYIFGFLDTGEGSKTCFNGSNALAAYTLNPDKAATVGLSVEELLKESGREECVGRFVYYGSADTDMDGEEDPLVWYVLDASENEVLLMSRDILFLKDDTEPAVSVENGTLTNLSKAKFTAYLWKNGSGYDTIAAAAPTTKCLYDMISLWGNDSFTELVYYTDYTLSEIGLFAGADGVGVLSDGNGSLLDLLGVRPCVKIKFK